MGADPSIPDRVLITGGAGFLGSHLCERLTALGHEVICLDNLESGRLDNVRHLLDGAPGDGGRPDGNGQAAGRLGFVEHDVTRPFPELPPLGRIYNLACSAAGRRWRADPLHVLGTCFLGARNVLELARRHGCRVLQASAAAVYGDPDVHPQPESYWGHVDPTAPGACHDEGKRVAETLFFDHHRIFGVDIRVVRIFDTYGPRMPDDGRVVGTLLGQALRGAPLTVHGDGQQTRSFCYVDDMVEGLMLAMEGPDVGPLNLGSPHELSILALAWQIKRLTGSPSPIRFVPAPGEEPRRRQPAVRRARVSLRWQPKVPLEEGVRRMLGSMGHHPRQPPATRPKHPPRPPAPAGDALR